jgi:hypothetical protein
MTDITPAMIEKLHFFYDNKLENLSIAAVELSKDGLSPLEIARLMRTELDVSLGDALYYGNLPDYTGG